MIITCDLSLFKCHAIVCRICVFSPDGAAFLRTFKTEFRHPQSIAVCGGALYVLSNDAVHVFE